MEQNAVITVRGKDAAYTVRGAWRPTADGWMLSYAEPAASGLGAVDTSLAIEGASAVLTRTGAVRSGFRFTEGAAHTSVYETPHGSFPAEVVTHALRTKLNGRGGLVELRYTLRIGGVADEHRLKIRIRTEETA